MNKCGIVKDLFAAYVSGISSEETRALVEEHISACEDCRAKLAEVQNRVAVTLREKDANSINVFKTMKKKIFRRNVVVAMVASIIVAVLALFIGVKKIDGKPIAYYDGLLKVRVNYVDYYKNEDNISVVITDPSNQIPPPPNGETPPKADGKLAVLDIACMQNYYSSEAIGRTITRDGERVRVEYVCYNENAFTRQAGEPRKEEENIFRITHFDESWVPIRTELYYITDFKFIDSAISDEEFDNYRHQGTLVWSGMVQ